MQQPPRFYADADTFLLIVAHLSTTDVLACGVACTTLRALCDDVLSKSSVARLGPLATPEEMLWLLRTRVGAECTRLDVSDCTALSKSVVSRGVSACPHLVTLQAVRVGVGSWTALSLQRLLQSAPPSLRHAHVDLRVALDELQGPATLAHRLLSSPSLKVGKLVLVASEAAVGHAAPDLEAVRALGATLGAKHTELAELDASSGSLRGIGLVDALLSPLLLAPSCGLRTLACSAIPRLCARALVTALGGNRSLRSLALGCNSLDAAAAVALGAALRGHPSLTSLQVEHNQILDRGAAALADALPATRIASLRLSFTGAADGCMRAVAASLTEGCSLAELRLSGNLVGQEGAVALAAALGSAGSSLRALSLSANWKVDTAAQLAVVGALAGSELHELSLAGCNVSTSTCEKLAAALGSCSLRQLDLSSNHFGDVGAWALAWALPECHTLHVLDLSCCEITADGAAELHSSLPPTDGQAQAGAELAPPRTPLGASVRLDLRGNRIDVPADHPIALDSRVNLSFQRAAVVTHDT